MYFFRLELDAAVIQFFPVSEIYVLHEVLEAERPFVTSLRFPGVGCTQPMCQQVFAISITASE